MKYAAAPVVILALVWAVAPWASAAALHVEAGASRDVLSASYADWHGSYVEASWTNAPRQVTYGSVRTSKRFNLYDSEVLAGASFPLFEHWIFLVEANASPTHSVLPHGSGLLQIEATLAGGIGAQLGIRHTQYNDVWSNQVNVTLERYYGNHYASGTLFSGQLEGGGSPASQRVQWRYYYGDASHVGLSYTRGIEIEHAPNNRTLTSDIRTMSLGGRHELTPEWAASFELLRHEQGTSYVRRGLRVGLRFRY